MAAIKTFQQHSLIYIVSVASTCAFFLFVVYNRPGDVILYRKMPLPHKKPSNELLLSKFVHFGRDEDFSVKDHVHFVKGELSPGRSQNLPDNKKDILRFGETRDMQHAEEMITSIQTTWETHNYSQVIKLPNRSFTVLQPDFQKVAGIRPLLYVHAALWQKDNVRITVVKKLNVPVTHALCVLWYSSDQGAKPYFVKAIVKDLQSFGVGNACGYLKCIVDEGDGKKDEIPVLVSLINGDSPKQGLAITLPVENKIGNKKSNSLFETSKAGSLNEMGSRMVEFTVCMPTMFKNKKAAQLVQKLEMIKLMGAGRVVMYNTSVEANVEAVLRMYAREFAAGRETLEVIVHSWRLPPIKLHYYGQMAAADDCLYRYKWSSRYMVFDDLDELIVPIHHANWSQLIAERERVNPGAGAFMFRSSVMANDHSTPAKGFETEAFRYHSDVLRVTERAHYIYPPVKKSKLIVNPTMVHSVGVHHVFESSAITDVVPPDEGLLFHYRWPITVSCHRVRDTRVVDKYGKQLALSLKTAWAKLKGVPPGWDPVNSTVWQACLPKTGKAKIIQSNKRRAKVKILLNKGEKPPAKTVKAENRKDFEQEEKLLHVAKLISPPKIDKSPPNAEKLPPKSEKLLPKTNNSLPKKKKLPTSRQPPHHIYI